MCITPNVTAVHCALLQKFYCAVCITLVLQLCSVQYFRCYSCAVCSTQDVASVQCAVLDLQKLCSVYYSSCYSCALCITEDVIAVGSGQFAANLRRQFAANLRWQFAANLRRQIAANLRRQFAANLRRERITPLAA